MYDNGHRARPSSLLILHHRHHHHQHRHHHYHHHLHPFSVVSVACLPNDWTTSPSTDRDRSSPTTRPRTAIGQCSSQVSPCIIPQHITPHHITSHYITPITSSLIVPLTWSHYTLYLSPPSHLLFSHPSSLTPPGHDQNRLLTLWYGFFFFAEPKVERLVKRFMRDRVRYLDIIGR